MNIMHSSHDHSHSVKKTLLLPPDITSDYDIDRKAVAIYLLTATLIHLSLNFSQTDEIEALTAIYGDEWCVIDEESRIFCIRVTDQTDNPNWILSLQVLVLIIITS